MVKTMDNLLIDYLAEHKNKLEIMLAMNNKIEPKDACKDICPINKICPIHKNNCLLFPILDKVAIKEAKEQNKHDMAKRKYRISTFNNILKHPKNEFLRNNIQKSEALKNG
jgi:hypothetical protein